MTITVTINSQLIPNTHLIWENLSPKSCANFHYKLLKYDWTKSGKLSYWVAEIWAMMLENCGQLKLYCRYLYTRPCMINHIWGLKQLWLQVNGHAWFHLQRLRWPVRNGEGAKNSKWKYMPPAGFEPTPRKSTTGKLQRLRPLGHAG